MSLFRWALVCFLVAVPALAQSQTFEKITIKPVRSVDPRSMRLQVLPDGELIAHAVLVIELVTHTMCPPTLRLASTLFPIGSTAIGTT